MIGASGFLVEELRREMRMTNRDQQLRVLQNELRSLVVSSEAITTEMHKYIHELLASIESGEPYGGYFPEQARCKFCGEDENNE